MRRPTVRSSCSGGSSRRWPARWARATGSTCSPRPSTSAAPGRSRRPRRSRPADPPWWRVGRGWCAGVSAELTGAHDLMVLDRIHRLGLALLARLGRAEVGLLLRDAADVGGNAAVHQLAALARFDRLGLALGAR